MGAGWFAMRSMGSGLRGSALWLALVLLVAFGVPPQAAVAAERSGRPSAKVKVERKAVRAAPARKVRPVRVAKRSVVVPARLSFGQIAGLRATDDPLNLASSVALVIDPQSGQVLFSKNSDAVLPIASITKLMTAMVVLESAQPLDEELTITQDDVDTEKGSRSRLGVGTRLTRGEMLHLALMSSENRAAHALGRHHPGGLSAFVAAMNAKAHTLGMTATRYVEPTGLSSANQSTAADLAMLVKAASDVPLIRELSTAQETAVAIGSRHLQFRNTNALIRHPDWDISLQKTGYISEAGRCVVMQARLAGRQLIMVLLDSAGAVSRMGDAERLRSWISTHVAAAAADVAPSTH
jgi:D-alanyl-D-alanine endopeptidase (penicillin-binding protein 7)